MSIFTADTSTQGTGGFTNTITFNSKDDANIKFFSKSGIYNSADNTIKIFTNNIDALTIDANQKVTCDGSLITNLAWGNIDGKPSFFDGTWNSLSGKPTNFQSDWDSTVINKPTLFDGTWTSLSGKPTNFQADWLTTVTNIPTLFDGTWNSLSGKPTNFQADWLTTVTNKPTLFDGTWNSLSGKPTLFDGTWTSLSGKPTFATVATSGLYNDLSGRPDLTLKQDVISVSNPITKTGNTIGLSYNSTLTLNGTQLSVASSASSKWTLSGTNIYNNNTGNVGINISAPRQKLDVYGGNAVIRATGEGGSAILYLGTPFNSTSSGFKSAIIAEGITNWSRSKLHFCMENTATDAPNATVSGACMTILSDGKIGIGTNNPQYQFNLHGKNMIGGYLYFKLSSATTGNGAGQGYNISMAEDGTSYLWNNSAKPLIFATANTERMRISDTGNIGINVTAPNAYGKLQVNGVVNFHGGTTSAVSNNYMSAGSLTIGDITVDYGNGSSWNTNTAGLLLECKDKTEIAVHDAGLRVNSLINFVGGSTNNYHEYGRNMGWGHPTAHYFRCNQTFECYFANATNGWNYFKVEPTSLWGDGLSVASDQGGTKYLTMRNLMFQNPHIVPESVGGVAQIRLGRAGGVSSGTWWELSTGVAGTFRIIKEQDYKFGITISQRGNIGVANDAPIDVSGDTNACSLILGKCQGGYQHRARIHLVKDDNNLSQRQIILTQDNLFNFSICDGGGQNNLNSVTFIVQVNYAAPATSLFIDSSGYVQMRMGYGLSDQRTKTNIKTIDDALLKVLHLRGVEYNDIEIGDRRIGLIAQEVEGVIPEVVHTNENTGVKSIAYGNMTGILVNAIKELNDLVVKQNKIINNLIERIEKLENGNP